MRLKYVFSHPMGTMAIDYNHLMRSWFSDFLSKTNENCYKDKSTDRGVDSRKFKLFTFSKLIFESYKVREHRISFYAGTAQWYVSSPVEEFLNDFSAFIKTMERVCVEGICFELQSTEEVEMPPFDKEMKFTSLSPITVTTEGMNEMYLDNYFLKFEDSEFIKKIKNNLIDKYRLFSGKKLNSDTNFNFEFDHEYLQRKKGRIQKKIKYERHEILGYLAPFTVVAEPELLKFGYDTGFGDYCHMGFGMAKEVYPGF